MTPLHTFSEYQCAKAVLAQLIERKSMERYLSETDQAGMDELQSRIELFEQENQKLNGIYFKPQTFIEHNGQ